MPVRKAGPHVGLLTARQYFFLPIYFLASDTRQTLFRDEVGALWNGKNSALEQRDTANDT